MQARSHPASAYRQVSIQTAPPAQVVVLLYRRAVLSAQLAADAIEQKKLEKAHHNLIRAQAIVVELRAALNWEAGSVAASLDSIYDYLYRRLTEANLKKDAEAAREVARLLESLLEAWEAVLTNTPPARPGTSVAV